MEKFTKGPWKAGNGCVTSEHSNGITISGATGEDAIKYYGGNLIGESISQCNSHLIEVAPDMYAEIKADLERMLETQKLIEGKLVDELLNASIKRKTALLAKARGEL